MKKQGTKRIFAMLLTVVMLLSVAPLGMFSAYAYSPRTTAPTSSNAYYYSNNVFYTSGYGMPNCTCYAYGRAYELLGSKPKLSTGNAGAWWQYNINNGYYPYGQTPKLGAIAVWDKYDNNQGHVAVVEAINGSQVTISESHYQGTFFNTRTINSDSSNYLTSYRFRGYIYVIDEEPPEPQYADLGDDFYGVILNTAHWKPISRVPGTSYVYLNSEDATSNQTWHFIRQDDGSYVIESCLDGKALELYAGGTDVCTPIAACSDDWGGAYQRWYFIPKKDGYMIMSKHYTSIGLYIDNYAGNSDDGNIIQINTKTEADAQIWSVYSNSDVQLRPTTLSVTPGTSSSLSIFSIGWTYGETANALKIWKDKLYEGEPFHVNWDANSGYGITLPAGKYFAYVDTLDYFRCLQSNIVEFTVEKAPCNWSSSYTIDIQPTCTEKGSKSIHCLDCSERKNVTEIPALGHAYGSWTTTKAATCTAEGVQTRTCSRCNNSETKTIAKTAHTVVTDPAVAATCTAAGKTQGSHCSVCSAVITAQQTVNALGHAYGSWTTTKAATCTAEGVQTRTCSRCSTSETKAIAKTAHTVVTDQAVAATCTAAGKTQGSHCSVCSAVITAQQTVNALGHAYGSWTTTKAATCTAEGVQTRTCSRCNNSETKAIAKTAHTVVTDPAVAATCTATGKTQGSHCSVCSAVITAQQTVNALGHAYGSWTTTKAATCTAEGVQTRTCSRCNNSETKAIAKTAHTPKTVAGYPATCSKSGLTNGTVCSICSTVITAQQTIAATGNHADNDHNGKCDSCSKVLDPTVGCSCNCHKGGFQGFIFKIILFFQKIFKTNKVCQCGVNHY